MSNSKGEGQLPIPWTRGCPGSHPDPGPPALQEGGAGRRYSPTLLRELLLSESEGMMDKTLYVEPGGRKGEHLLLTPRGLLSIPQTTAGPNDLQSSPD